jgi:hypothetical protein
MIVEVLIPWEPEDMLGEGRFASTQLRLDILIEWFLSLCRYDKALRQHVLCTTFDACNSKHMQT